MPFAFALVALVVVRHRAAIERDGTLVVVVVVALAIARVARSIARRIVVRRPRAEMTKHFSIHSSSSLSDARDAFDVRAREGDDRGASDDRWRRPSEDARARRG